MMCSGVGGSQGRKAVSHRTVQKMSAAHQKDAPPQRLHHCDRGTGHEAGTGSRPQAAPRWVCVWEREWDRVINITLKVIIIDSFIHLQALNPGSLFRECPLWFTRRNKSESRIHWAHFREVEGNKRTRRNLHGHGETRWHCNTKPGIELGKLELWGNSVTKCSINVMLP